MERKGGKEGKGVYICMCVNEKDKERGWREMHIYVKRWVHIIAMLYHYTMYIILTAIDTVTTTTSAYFTLAQPNSLK